MTRLKIIEETEPNRLLHIYPRQEAPQGCFLYLDCETGQFGADWDAQIGNAVPSDVWHGHTRWYPIPVLQDSTVNALLAELAPLAQRVLDGYASEWNGNNLVGAFDDDAQAAEAEIGRAIEDYGDGDLHWADARDWLYGIEDELVERIANGETIDSLIDELDGDGSAEDKPVLVGLLNYVESLKED